jgi:hypothetical protein
MTPRSVSIALAISFLFVFSARFAQAQQPVNPNFPPPIDPCLC